MKKCKMIDAGGIGEIIAVYKKHGWILRRVLLSAGSMAALEDSHANIFEDAQIQDSGIDAAWFSRPPKTGGVAWEIRYLGDIPFALLEYIDEYDPEFESALQAIEGRLSESIMAKNQLDKCPAGRQYLRVLT